MSNQKNAEQNKPAEISPEQIEAFLTDHRANAEKHGLDFAINYDLTEDGAVKAKFVIVPKPIEGEEDANNT